MTTATQKPVRRVQIGTVMVDSGMVMVVDPCYVLADNWGEKHGLIKGFDQSKTSYEQAMESCYHGTESFRVVKEKDENGKMVVESIGVFNPLDEMTPEKHRQIAYGTVCTTVQGDGTYPVYAVYVGDSLIGLEVRFDD